VIIVICLTKSSQIISIISKNDECIDDFLIIFVTILINLEINLEAFYLTESITSLTAYIYF